MKPTFILFILCLIGVLSATQYQFIGGLFISGNHGIWTVKVYEYKNLTDDRCGFYQSRGDRSAGAIYLNTDKACPLTRSLSHEFCHARQDYERRAFNETECYRRAGQWWSSYY